MGKSGKRYDTAAAGFDRDQMYSGSEALGLVSSLAAAKFDESIDLLIRLGVDPRKTDEMVRGTVALPSGTGRDVRVAVFAQGEAAAAAREAGADHVGADDLAAEVEGGMLDFDVAIATPDMMPAVGKLGRSLGPRGLMPNPKSGTVTDDVAKAVGEFKGGKVEFRTDRFGNVHLPIGKASFEASDLSANLKAAVEELERLKPSSAKGRYLKKVSVSSTMGPGIRIDPLRVAEQPPVVRPGRGGGGAPERHRYPDHHNQHAHRRPPGCALAQNEIRHRPIRGSRRRLRPSRGALLIGCGQPARARSTVRVAGSGRKQQPRSGEAAGPLPTEKTKEEV